MNVFGNGTPVYMYQYDVIVIICSMYSTVVHV